MAGNDQFRSVSICILTCNRDALLRPLLEELHKQLRPEDEIVVLDTGGSSATQALVEGFNSHQVRYRAYPMEQFDFATARNQLLGLAKCDGIAFIDDDAFPFPDWLTHVRNNLQRLEATGGVTVANGEVPEWWDPEINWCVGLSPPGTALGMAGYYPDTCNLAADTALWRQKPFAVIEREGKQLYATGREDAEWWVDRRLEGRDIATSYRQAVAHYVHPNRLTLAYVKQRARNDGVSSWLRRPSYEAATAIPWDLAHIVGVVAAKAFRKPFSPKERLADMVWMHRQWGKFGAVWNSPVEHRPRHREQITQLLKAAAFQIRIRAGELAFTTLNIVRHLNHYPALAPQTIFVSADCHVGDSVLLRRHVQALAVTFPTAKVLVSCRHPVLLTGLAENVHCRETSAMSRYIREAVPAIDAAIVPYFPFGDVRLWRDQLSTVGTTFDCDVSFTGRRDYLYARRLVKKNLELHEHENLARLFQLWPLRKVADVPPPVVPQEDIDWRDEMLRSQGISDYILVQFGAGQDFKEWPLDCWIPFLQSLARNINLPIVIIGGENWADAANVAVREVQHEPGVFNLIPSTNLTRLMSLVKKAFYFIGGCSGPKHLAIAYGVPTFTLYAATEPERWGAAHDWQLHSHVAALPQKFTAMELQGLGKHHRVRLLKPEAVAAAALAHFSSVRSLT